MSEFFALNNGDSLHFDEYGASRHRTTLVALHGLGGGGYFFAGVGHSLASGIRSVFPDLPGSGFSRRGDRPISFDRFTDAVVELIERKIDSPIALMGHSMGTIIALKIYARVPDRIGSMIFVGGLPAPLPEAQARLRDRAALARAEGMAAVAPTIVPVVFAQKSLDAIPDKVMMFQRLLAQSDAEGYAQTALALADASAADIVQQVRVPCLCITGAEDRYAPPAAVRCFADSIPDTSHHELADCGHMPFLEASDTFINIVQGFLAQVK